MNKTEEKEYKTDWKKIGRELLKNRKASGLNTYYNMAEVEEKLK